MIINIININKKTNDEGTRKRIGELSRDLEANTEKVSARREISKRSVQTIKRLGVFNVNVINKYTPFLLSGNRISPF